MYPLLLLYTPLTIICAMQVISFISDGYGFLVAMLIMTVPGLNAISVLCLVPAYRRVFTTGQISSTMVVNSINNSSRKLSFRNSISGQIEPTRRFYK